MNGYTVLAVYGRVYRRSHTIGVGQQHGQRQEVAPGQLPADQQQQHAQQRRAAQAQVVGQVMPYAGTQPARYRKPHRMSRQLLCAVHDVEPVCTA